MEEQLIAIYNEQYENTGECLYSEYLGCKECKTCKVEEYEKKVQQILKEEHKKEQILLEKIYGAEDKSDIYENDEECVNNKHSPAYKKVLKYHNKHKDDKYYPGIEDLITSTCYECNRCGIWGKK